MQINSTTMAKIKNISALNKFKEHESTLKYANSTIELTDLKTLVENGIKFFSTRLKNKIKRTENSKLSSELKIIECFEDNYFINEYLLLLDKINIRLKLTSFETIKNYKFFKVQTLPFEKNITTFEIFEKIISEKFATFGVDGFYRPFLIELIESYYNEMLQKSIELQRTFENQTQLTKNFNRLCIEWLTFILDQYNEANKKEAPHYIKPFLDYCKAKEPKQTEVENNDCENEASKEGTITETKIPMKQIALLHYYNGITITRQNANTIAKKYNYTAINSGEGLYQDYLFFTSNANRHSSGETKIKLNNKIKLFENVIKLLTTENAKSKATTELNMLKNKLIEFQ